MELAIQELLYKKKKLKAVAEDVLVDLVDEFPYSAVLHLLVNKKHYIEHNNLSLNKIKDYINITDNPGTAFAGIIDVKKSNKKTKTAKKQKKIKQEQDNLKSEIISEQLAEIYLKQGMKKEAIEMYRKLSLQNPEKSVYFAKILKKLNKN